MPKSRECWNKRNIAFALISWQCTAAARLCWRRPAYSRLSLWSNKNENAQRAKNSFISWQQRRQNCVQLTSVQLGSSHRNDSFISHTPCDPELSCHASFRSPRPYLATDGDSISSIAPRPLPGGGSRSPALLGGVNRGWQSSRIIHNVFSR